MLCTAYLTTCRNEKMHTLGTNLRFLLNVRCSSGNRWPAWPYFSLSLLSMWPLSAHAVAQCRITYDISLIGFTFQSRTDQLKSNLKL